MTSGPQRLALVVAGAASTIAVWQLIRRTPTVRGSRWRRTNYRGREVSMLGGPIVVAVAAVGCTVIAVRVDAGARRVALAMLVAVVSAGVVGGYDDLRGDATAKGLAGHLRAARSGRVTSGALKLAALPVVGLAAALIVPRRVTAWVVVDALLIAGLANLSNLFDLRPGRAAKVCAVAFAGLIAWAAAPVVWCAGVTLGILRGDLHEELMLGDAGANALGAALGVGVVVTAVPWVRLTALAVVAALTLLSEAVSFSRVIDSNPVLRRLDRAGRLESERHAPA